MQFIITKLFCNCSRKLQKQREKICRYLSPSRHNECLETFASAAAASASGSSEAYAPWGEWFDWLNMTALNVGASQEIIHINIA